MNLRSANFLNIIPLTFFAVALTTLVASCNSNTADNAITGTINTQESTTTNPPVKTSVADCALFAKDPFVTRNDLIAGSRSDTAGLLLRFVQYTDDHIIDDDGQAINGASFLDPVQSTFESAQRLQEEYSDEVLNDIISRTNDCNNRFPSEFMIVTGDSADLTTVAELRRFIDNLDGTFDQMSAFEENCRKALPAGTPEAIASFQCTRYTGRGVADTQTADADPKNPVYNTTLTRSIAQLVSTTQAVLSGRDAAGKTNPANQTFNRAAGLPPSLRCTEGAANCVNQSLKMPWYVAFGNHDGYLRGTAAIVTGVNEASTATGRHHLFKQHEFIDEFYKTRSEPKGHGFQYVEDARKNDSNPRNDGYYAFDAGNGKFRMIVMNTIIDGTDPRIPTDQVRNPFALADGTVDKVQFEWVKKELANAYAKKQLVMVFSHHPDLTFAEYGMFAPAVPIEVTAAQLNGELASWPHMIGWVAGHTHRHRVRSFKVDAQGMGTNGVVKTPVTCKVANACKGFWQIESASLIDSPQEQRMLEIFDNKNGTGVIRAPVLTHGFERSRALADRDDRCQFYFTDPAAYTRIKNSEADLSGLCVYGGTRQGDKTDRNVELMFAMPTFTQ